MIEEKPNGAPEQGQDTALENAGFWSKTWRIFPLWVNIILILILVFVVIPKLFSFIIDFRIPFKRHITVELILDGTPVKLERTTWCYPYKTAFARDMSAVRMGLRAPIRYYPSVRRVSYKLENKTHFMMKLPATCRIEDAQHGPTILTTKDLFKRKVIVALTDLPDDKSKALYYDHPNVWQHPDARVQDVKITITPTSFWSDIDEDDRESWAFSPWLSYVPDEKFRKRNTMVGIGYFVMPGGVYEDAIKWLDDNGYDTSAPYIHINRETHKIRSEQIFEQLCPDARKSKVVQSTDSSLYTMCRGMPLQIYGVEFKDFIVNIPRGQFLGLASVDGYAGIKHSTGITKKITFEGVNAPDKESFFSGAHLYLNTINKQALVITKRSFSSAKIQQKPVK